MQIVGQDVEDPEMFGYIRSRTMDAFSAIPAEDVHIMTPRQVFETLTRELASMGIETCSILGPDAIRVDRTDKGTGYTVRYELEDDNPIMRFLESEAGLVPAVARKEGPADS